jgi:hypothetical protein
VRGEILPRERVVYPFSTNTTLIETLDLPHLVTA